MTTVGGVREHGAADGRPPAWPELRIDRMRVRLFEARSAPAAPMSFGDLWPRRMCLVELWSDGVAGVGESWINHPSWAWAERIATLTNGVAPLVEKTVVTDPRELQATLRRQLEPVGRQWGAPGPVWQAISAVDLALWDLVGQVTGRSIGECLRPGKVAPTVPVYASGVGPDRVAELVEHALGQGFTAVKVKVGFGRDRDVETLRTVRRVAGPTVRLFVDANQAWSVSQAVEMAAVLRDFAVEWCEEPVRGNAVSCLEELHRRTGMALATGENLYGVEEFAPYLRSPAVAHIQPDVSKAGGISVVDQVARSAATTGTGVSLHCYSGIANLAASLQLASTLDSLSWVEVDVRDNPLRTEVVEQPLEIVDGHVRLPTGPGLGLRWDEKTLARYETDA